MVPRFRHRIKGEKGFTLIELLVVILIIGILAAIAIPSFINQKGKANDASAKSQARTAQTASETLATDSSGTYANVTLAALKTTEPTLADTSSDTLSLPVASTTTTYTVKSTNAASSDWFQIARGATGIVTRACGPVSTGACPASGIW